ncbi:MAG TPA: hypothetical protein VMV37_02790, partial [Gammaproteobacteria bacterium]|nr:hypothetical protein [Gammaproteobacteria bacterium]
MGMRFAAIVAALLLALAQPAPGYAATTPLDMLLAKVRVASGKPYDAHVVSEARLAEGGVDYTLHSESE